MKFLKSLVAATVLLSGFAVAAEQSDQALIERIKPVGEISKSGVVAAGGGGGAARSGADIIKAHCGMCHGVMPGAPKTAQEWADRAKAAGGIDGLVASATKGKNAMPPKGMCQDCTPAELKAAITELSKGK